MHLVGHSEARRQCQTVAAVVPGVRTQTLQEQEAVLPSPLHVLLTLIQVFDCQTNRNVANFTFISLKYRMFCGAGFGINIVKPHRL